MSLKISKVTANDAVLRLVQITDTHLNRQPGGRLLGLDTDFSLQHVVDLVNAEQPHIDVVLGTGDISDQGCEEAYHRARTYFDQVPGRKFWIPGNHDVRSTMTRILGDGDELDNLVRIGRWQIVLLSTSQIRVWSG